MSSILKTIQFPSVIDNIHLVEQFVEDICAEYRIKEDYFGEILISMTEAVNNAIVHGNKLDTSKNVTVQFEVPDDKNLRFRVEDEGPGFDYDSLPDPTAPENIEKPHGRGVFLMRNLADRCQFIDNGRIVELDFAVLESIPA
ncbi:MAG: ATP-binding protein [Crocinitomicaceae bacterium]|nr:ATP-binding protein [Crocinitomicaceae bacterium]